MKLTDFTALSFDCYGTLIDWETGILDLLDPWADENELDASPDELLAAFGRHETLIEFDNPALLYPIVLRAVMRAIGADYRVRVDRVEVDALAQSVGSWPPFPDTREALGYLKRHYKLAILSNVDNESFAATAAKLRVELDLVVTAEDVGSYKPNPKNFRALLARLGEMGLTPDKVLHCAQSRYHDIAPAREAGLATAWIDRRHGKPGPGATPPAEAEPDFTFPSLAALVAAHRGEIAAGRTGDKPPVKNAPGRT